jgi:diguanylate cyclase (GGDEF)-like protein
LNALAGSTWIDRLPAVMALLPAAALLWAAATVALLALQRAGAAARESRAGWRVAGGVTAGVGIWAAHQWLLAAASGAAAASMPVAWTMATLALSAAGTTGSLAFAASPRRPVRIAASAAGSALHAAALAIWIVQLALPYAEPMAALICAAVLGAQASALLLLARRTRQSPDLSLQRAATQAALPAVVAVTPLALVVTLGGPASTPGPEAVIAVVVAMMMALALRATQMDLQHARRQRAADQRLRQTHEQLERTPLVDALTGLPNRLGLQDTLAREVEQAKASQQRLGLVFIGLDGFRAINEAHGMSAGDEVLGRVGKRLTSALRPRDKSRRWAAGAVARVGGDEFVVVVRGAFEASALNELAQRLAQRLGAAMKVGSRELNLTASMGLAVFPDDGDASRLLAHANVALQAAKQAGGAAHMAFQPHMVEDARQRLELLRDLRQAVSANQLELVYQPKIDARTGQVTAAEALLRWNHPARGTVSPGVFIPLAEQHGVIAELGNWVIDEACRQARRWREQGLRMRVAINLSAYQMRQDDLVDRIEQALLKNGITPSRLTCEITETVAMEDTQVTRRTFERLGQAGVHLSIDDFGTGHSSLAYLRKLPARELKVDRSFVMDLGSSADARAIVDAVVKLAHAIGLKVVAEGVETEAQRDALIELGCDELQGFLFARPLSARALLLWALDDQPARLAFRESLFSETNTPTVIADALGPLARDLRNPTVEHIVLQ